jgi:hypothetical protein
MDEAKDSNVGDSLFIGLSLASIPIGSDIIFSSIHHQFHWCHNSSKIPGAHTELRRNLVDKEYHAGGHVLHASGYITRVGYLPDGRCVGTGN